jgi:Zn-dependent peptidase ImmA (M78 family)
MPSDWIKRDFKLLGDANALAEKYEVSREAMWYRLMELKLIR